MQKASNGQIRWGAIAAVAAIVVTAACDQRSDAQLVLAPAACVDTATTPIVSPTSATLAVGDSIQLIANAGCAAVGQVSWTSDNVAVATVAPTTGWVHALSPGSATIRATNSTRPNVSGAAVIQVVSRGGP